MNKWFAYGCIILSFSSSLYAKSKIKSISADPHIKIVQYDANNVVPLKGRYGYQTEITFAANETVSNIAIGDSLAWLTVASFNHIFIKPVSESKTNMTVLTNVNSYNFELDSRDNTSPPIYKLQFQYPQNQFDSASFQSSSNKSFNPDDLNWKYSFTGDKELVPTEVFDDRHFTYFKFKENALTALPAIFTVDKNRHESLVNFHMQDKYLVVNAIAKQFTLRSGDTVTSIYNDFAIGDAKHIR